MHTGRRVLPPAFAATDAVWSAFGVHDPGL